LFLRKVIFQVVLSPKQILSNHSASTNWACKQINITKEKVRRTFLATAKFTAGRDEYLPIPQAEITFTNGLYKQNPGYY